MITSLARLVMVPAASLLLAACSPSGGTDQTPPVTANQPSASIVEPWTIEGDYEVAFINQKAPVKPSEWPAMKVRITSDQISWQSQCVYGNWAYQGSGEDYSTRPYVNPDSIVGRCARANTDDENTLDRALGSLETIRRTNDGIYLEGGGATIQLRRLVTDDQRAARAVDLTGKWRVGALDGKAFSADHRIELTGEFRNIWWEPGCAGQGREYAIRCNRFETVPPGQQPREVCDIGFPPELPQIFQAMDAAETIARTADNGVLISGGGRSVLLYSQ